MSSSADQEGVKSAKEAILIMWVELKIYQACEVWNCDETG